MATKTAFTTNETIAEAAGLAGLTGAVHFALCWSHPEYPGVEEPPAGVPVVWTVAAVYRRSARLTAAALAVDRLFVTQLDDGRSCVAVSARSANHEYAVASACVEFMRRLGARVRTMGSEPAPLVDTPAEAILEAVA